MPKLTHCHRVAINNKRDDDSPLSCSRISPGAPSSGAKAACATWATWLGPNYGVAINDRLVNTDGRRPIDGRSSAGTGIDIHGQVVGNGDHLDALVHRGRRMESLNALIDPELGWQIQWPQAIKDAGQIAAIAVAQGVSYAVRLDLIRSQALAAPDVQKDGED